MRTNKFLKSILFILTISINLFGFCIDNSLAYPVFAQQNYANPRAANGKLACANCHLNQKAIEVEAPQAVLPNSVFEIEVKVPYDINKKQIVQTVQIVKNIVTKIVPDIKMSESQTKAGNQKKCENLKI